MKKGFFAVCLMSMVASAAVVVYAYRNDKEVKRAIDGAAHQVRDFAMTVKQRLDKKKESDQVDEEAQILRNQTWADQQWEALGI